MKKFTLLSAIFLASAIVFLASPSHAVTFQVASPSTTTFYGTFRGFGAEWDPFYFNTANTSRGTTQADWDNVITPRLKALRVGIVRMMMQLFWAQNLDNPTQWTWDTTQMRSVFKYLDFCQANNITVVLTDWGWSIGDWSAIKSPTDAQFADGIAEYLKEFIVRRGYTCIKYLIIGNEPDNEIAVRYGTDAYLQMYHNIDQALKNAGVRNLVKLTGPDMGGFWDFGDAGISGLKDIADTYDFHRYATQQETSNIGIGGTWASLRYFLDRWRDQVNTLDPINGAKKELLVCEMGMANGGTFGHPLIDTFDYAIHMADYGTTLLTTRIQAGIAWCMHDAWMLETENQFMGWGMWKYADQGWALRPWAQSFGLLIKFAPPGSVQAAVDGAPPGDTAVVPYRCAAVKRPDNGWSIFLVNRDSVPLSVTLQLPETPARNFERYQFDSTTFAAQPSQIAIPPIGTVTRSNQITLSVPAASFTVLAEPLAAQTGVPPASPKNLRAR